VCVRERESVCVCVCVCVRLCAFVCVCVQVVYVDKHVEVPVERVVVQEKVKIVYQDRVVEKIVEVPVEKIVYQVLCHIFGICIYLYVYICIYRPKKVQRFSRNYCVCMYVYVYVYTYIHAYIYSVCVCVVLMCTNVCTRIKSRKYLSTKSCIATFQAKPSTRTGIYMYMHMYMYVYVYI